MSAQCSFFRNSSYCSPFQWNSSACPCDSNYSFTVQASVSLNEKAWKSKQITLRNQFLLASTKDGGEKWICYENSILRTQSDKREQSQTISLISENSIISIKGDVDLLLKTLKKFTVQEDFKQKFQLVKLLGQGSFAKVYSARAKQGSESVFAVKMFEKSLLQSDVDKKSLLKEIQVLRTLNHHSTISLIELYESTNFLYLVIEQLKGGSLNQYIEKNSPLSEQETSQIVYQLLTAVKYINSCGIFHRDLKPDNIMFKEKNNVQSVCITDFGLGDFYNSDGKYLFNRCGSIGFVAPEVLHDQIYDYKVDMYSIGIIMYNAITGIQPFQGDSQKKVFQNYIGEVNIDTLKLSEQGIQFIKKLLQPNPLQRMDVQQALRHPWFNEQSRNQFKMFAITPRQTFQNKNFLKPSPYYSPGLSPRSPQLVHVQSKLTPLQQVGYQKKVANFCPVEEFQLTSTSGYQDKPIQPFSKEYVRKSIFKHLEPLK